MSHYVALVISKIDENNDDLLKKAETISTNLLAPFNENMEVEPYEKNCYCIGSVAHIDAIKQVDAEMGNIDDVRDKFKEKYDKEKLSNEEKEILWQKLIMKRLKYRKNIIDVHPMKDKPNPSCGFDDEGNRHDDGSGCGGTGKYITTYNPKSKWDWWVIGGRWQGALDPDYDYEKDERNFTKCNLCNGTGMRNDEIGKKEREKNPDFACNSCQGSGVVLKFRLAPHNKGNIRKVSDIKDFIPFAIITPDGEWHEKAEMGWWCFTTNEKNEDIWEKEVKEIYAKNKDNHAILCDLHI